MQQHQSHKNTFTLKVDVPPKSQMPKYSFKWSYCRQRSRLLWNCATLVGPSAVSHTPSMNTIYRHKRGMPILYIGMQLTRTDRYRDLQIWAYGGHLSSMCKQITHGHKRDTGRQIPIYGNKRDNDWQIRLSKPNPTSSLWEVEAGHADWQGSG